jgi:hypothetical protein
MALHPLRDTFRRGAAIALTAVPLFFPGNADAALTPQQCRGVASLITAHLDAAPKKSFSSAFSQSVVKFVAPDGETLTCDGKPKDSPVPIIIVSKLNDMAIWKAVEEGAQRNGINVKAEVKVVAAPDAEPAVRAFVAERDRLAARASLTANDPR